MSKNTPDPRLRFGDELLIRHHHEAIAENALPLCQEFVLETKIEGNVRKIVAPADALHEAAAKAGPRAVQRISPQPYERRLGEQASHETELAAGIEGLLDNALGPGEALVDQMMPQLRDRGGAEPLHMRAHGGMGHSAHFVNDKAQKVDFPPPVTVLWPVRI